ncbi:MAG: hypothetical protein ABEK10_04355 [Candidatus Nanosalina sp.]
MTSFPDVDVCRREVSADLLGERDFEGGYNAGYRVGADELYDSVQGPDGSSGGLPGGKLVDDPDEYVLWVPLEDSTPVMDVEEDAMSYHVARARNAEVFRDEGFNVPDAGILGSDVGSFLVTPYVEHDFFEQRPKVPGGDPRRGNPHQPDPWYSEGRQRFESMIDSALEGVDGEELVSSGRVVNAGSGEIDDHNKNWGLVDSSLVRLDIGEVPAEGAVWEDMPYDGPEEFYRGEGIRDVARDVLEDLGMDPEAEISEEYRWLMRET